MGRVVFIVDDDVDDREFFCDALHEIDHSIQCICTANGSEAIALLSEPQFTLPDFIFLDMNMPRLGGKQCLSLIKNNHRLSHIPVIIFSNTRQYDEAEEARQLGAAVFLTKPSTYSELKQNLSWILSRSFLQNNNKIA
jgi:Response regulator containing CheY-like receiver, AAA-type ATPase, and DNA-binding domains